MVRIRPTAAGIVFFLLPPMLLYKGISRTATPALITGVGLPALVLLSLVFLIFGIYSVNKVARRAARSAGVLPDSAVIGFPQVLKVDPPGRGFLPGIRLSWHWDLRFGPFRYHTAAPLPVKAAGSALLVLPRRGEWAGRSFLRAGDPFGFFHFDYPLEEGECISVPPPVSAIDVSEIPGRPAASAAAAPRLKEDAEERLERRSYVPGDDPRRLDWNVYARTGEMLVRVGEEVVPDRGRLWLLVVSPVVRRFRKTQVYRLDVCLEASAALVRRMEAENQDVRALLPGEERWAGIDTDWGRRLARSLPPGILDFPSPGERLWVVGHPESPGVRAAASEAVNRGCRVTIAHPSTGFLTNPGRFDLLWYRKKLAQAEIDAEAEGFDVRRI